MREQKLTAIILKKQPYKEGDEIITLFSKEAGKIRALAKGVKKPLSKLQQKLQLLFLVEITLTGGDMPKIIGAEPIKVFASLRENLHASRLSFYALELVLKFTADEEKNEQLFTTLADFLEFLNSGSSEVLLNLGLAKFKMEMLEASGVGLSFPVFNEDQDKIFFSPYKGGFITERVADALPVSKEARSLFLQLKKNGFENLNQLLAEENYELQTLLSQFIEYQLERKIKSEKYL